MKHEHYIKITCPFVCHDESGWWHNSRGVAYLSLQDAIADTFPEAYSIMKERLIATGYKAALDEMSQLLKEEMSQLLKEKLALKLDQPAPAGAQPGDA